MAKRSAAPERTMQERDASVEKTYTFHRSYQTQSATAYVAEMREELTLEFFDWLSREPFKEGLTDMLMRFEEQRFGRPLEPAAHGVLLFSARYRQEHMRPPNDTTFVSDEQRLHVEAAMLALPVIEGEGAEAKAERIAIAAGLMKPDTKSKKATVLTMPKMREPGQDDDEPAHDVAGAHEGDESLDWGDGA